MNSLNISSPFHALVLAALAVLSVGYVVPSTFGAISKAEAATSDEIPDYKRTMPELIKLIDQLSDKT